MTLRADHVAGGVAIATAFAVLAVSGDLPIGTLSFPGAGMMPKLICALMILFGVLLIARAGVSPPFAEISWSDLPACRARVRHHRGRGRALHHARLHHHHDRCCCSRWSRSKGRNLFAAAAFSLGVTLSTYALFTVALKTPLEQGLLGF